MTIDLPEKGIPDKRERLEIINYTKHKNKVKNGNVIIINIIDFEEKNLITDWDGKRFVMISTDIDNDEKKVGGVTDLYLLWQNEDQLRIRC